MKVSNTGPLIIFYNCNFLWILRKLYGTIVIAEAVEKELTTKPEGQDIINNDWIKIERITNTNALRYLQSILDQGEAETIILAEYHQAPVLIDERKGRNMARALKLKIQGTLGTLVQAKKKGLIPSVKGSIQILLQQGYYLDQKLIDEVLKAVDE